MVILKIEHVVNSHQGKDQDLINVSHEDVRNDKEVTQVLINETKNLDHKVQNYVFVFKVLENYT